MAKTHTPAAAAPAKKEKASAPSAPVPTPRFAELYRTDIVPALMKQFHYKNTMAAPRLVKIVLNMGCGEAASEAKVLEEAQKSLAKISGQRPAVTRAKKAVSAFKIREGDAVGCKVTLRRARMYEFFERLIVAALPRIRDFRGLSAKSFDGRGSYSFGIQEQTVFPELHLDEVHYPLGMDIIIVTTAKTPQETRALLDGFGMPFEKADKS